MAQQLNGFGFQTKNVVDTDTNTNIANTNLTQDNNRTLEANGNSLDFLGSGNSLLKIEEDGLQFGEGGTIESVKFKFGTLAPDFRIFEASGSGTDRKSVV